MRSSFKGRLQSKMFIKHVSVVSTEDIGCHGDNMILSFDHFRFLRHRPVMTQEVPRLSHRLFHSKVYLDFRYTIVENRFITNISCATFTVIFVLYLSFSVRWTRFGWRWFGRRPSSDASRWRTDGLHAVQASNLFRHPSPPSPPCHVHNAFRRLSCRVRMKERHRQTDRQRDR